MNETLLKKLAKPLIVVATLIWGSTFFIIKDALDSVSLQFLLAFRFTVAAVILALVFWKRWRHLTRTCLWQGVVMGLFLYAAYTVQNIGIMYTTPGKNAFLTAVYCVLVPFLAWVFERKRPDKFNLLAAVLCVVGIGFVSWDGGFALNTGDGLTLISGLLYAFHILTATRFSRKEDVFLLTVIQFAAAAVCCWVGTWVTGGFPCGGLSPNSLAVLLYLAVAATALALLFQNIGQKYSDPSSAAVLLALEAPFGVAFSVLFGRESPNPFMYLGFFLIFVAILCSETKFRFLRRK